MAPFQNDISESIYTTVIFTDTGKMAYGILLQKLSYSGGQFARVSADVLLYIDTSICINYSKLPGRFLRHTDSILRSYGLFDYRIQNVLEKDPLATRLLRSHLGEPQTACFYVRQSPQPPSHTSIEAVGFCFDMGQNLPAGINIENQSFRWSRWPRASRLERARGYLHRKAPRESDHQDRFIDFDESDLDLSSSPTSTLDHGWNTKILGVLQLSDNANGNADKLSLCVGLRQTSVNLLNTPVSYPVPWCEIRRRRKLDDDPDHVVENFRSYRLTTSLAGVSSRRLAPVKDTTYFRYDLSIELQVRYGQVYYLIKLSRKRPHPDPAWVAGC
jgi:hypothetical protein